MASKHRTIRIEYDNDGWLKKLSEELKLTYSATINYVLREARGGEEKK